MPRFILEGPRPWRGQSFALRSYNMYQSRNRNFAIGYFIGQKTTNNCCLLWTVKTKNENKTIKQITLSSLITIPLYWLWSKHSLGWKNCLFGYVFLSFCCCFSFFESSRTSYFRTVFTLLLLTMFSVSHIYSWQLARLRYFSLSHAQGMFNLGRICKNSKAKIWKPA